MKPRQITFVALTLLGAACPGALSSGHGEADSALDSNNFEQQIVEGKAKTREINALSVVDDVLSQHPFLSNSDTDSCEAEGYALGECLVNADGGAVQIHECAMCFLSTLPADDADCAGLKSNDWCGELNKCMNEKCDPSCTSQFVSVSNCILTEVHCTDGEGVDYQCPSNGGQSPPHSYIRRL
mmetsp:Transcript_37036/g.78195  ORF Transcript_37036/g.78195 Transcript_37036/m.78195 type:complete len:183 (-) Transcript_37036:226-774(-)|eukprot:CAMPEP_0183730772 /NCGR_PEP_ID=MMETSP0737-20130205/33653_1 /TAXON_ID=385413 /ORGANISM="Thalassiosira miniscula, Strain CCMP1093" /LENGTH=182 /DNA_ID=CAMNT_0025963353 /DNA_START=44 /DNA_END=592 /DNA_ORIENTATION=-